MKNLNVMMMTLMMCLMTMVSFGQHLKKDGTPDRRYKENKISTLSSNTSSKRQKVKQELPLSTRSLPAMPTFVENRMARLRLTQLSVDSSIDMMPEQQIICDFDCDLNIDNQASLTNLSMLSLPSSSSWFQTTTSLEMLKQLSTQNSVGLDLLCSTDYTYQYSDILSDMESHCK